MLSPSVNQLFSTMSIKTENNSSDSGVDTQSFRSRGSSHTLHKTKNARTPNPRSNSMSPTKQFNQHNTPKTANNKKGQQSNFEIRKLPRPPALFAMKKQNSAPVGVDLKNGKIADSSKTIAITSNQTFRKQTPTASNKKFSHQSGNDSDSATSQKSGKSQKSMKSTKSSNSNTKKNYVRTAQFTPAGKPSTNGGRQRNDNSFCGTVFKDEMWAGSAAPPEATALPKPPIDWIKAQVEESNAGYLEKTTKSSKNPENQLANSVRDIFASFNSNPLVSTTA